MFRKNFLSEKTIFQTYYLAQQKQKGSAKTICRSKIFRTDYCSKNVSDRLFVEAKMFRKDFHKSKKCFAQAMYRSKKFRTDFLSEKNVPDRFFIGEEFPDRLLSEKNGPDRLFIREECSGQIFFIGEECSGQPFYRRNKIANGELHTKLVQIYFP
jgi:hypothetical protein